MSGVVAPHLEPGTWNRAPLAHSDVNTSAHGLKRGLPALPAGKVALPPASALIRRPDRGRRRFAGDRDPFAHAPAHDESFEDIRVGSRELLGHFG